MDSSIGAVNLLRDFTIEADRPAFVQLADRLRDEIVAGTIPPGGRMPSERAMGAALGVSRSTVVAALSRLRDERLIESRQGAGTLVRDVGVETSTSSAPGPVADLGDTILRPLGFVVDELLTIDRGAAIELVQASGLSRTGLLELRQAVSGYYADLGVPTDPDGVVITTGVHQALRLALRAVSDPGATVLLEEPSFAGAADTLSERNLRIMPVERSADGLDLEAVERAFAITGSRLLIVQPACHKPTGGTMTIAARRALLRICARYQATIIENASWNDASASEDPELPLPALSPRVRTITIGSANTIFWDGLSVAWVRSDPITASRMGSLVSPGDFRASMIAQHTTARLLRHIDAARRARRTDLRSNYQRMTADLHATVPEWSFREPAGGASLWVRLPTTGATAFTRIARWSGVTTSPGTAFSSIHALDDHVQLGFSTPYSHIADSLRTLMRVWNDSARPADRAR